jgi:hypothetical protein
VSCGLLWEGKEIMEEGRGVMLSLCVCTVPMPTCTYSVHTVMECLRNAKNEISAFFGSSFGFVSTLCITIHIPGIYTGREIKD